MISILQMRTLRHRDKPKDSQGQDLNPGSFAAEALLCWVTRGFRPRVGTPTLTGGGWRNAVQSFT